MTIEQPLTATYWDIVRVHIDRAGNLRLFERGRFGLGLRPRIFHPAAEWSTVSLDRTATALVVLAERERNAR